MASWTRARIDPAFILLFLALVISLLKRWSVIANIRQAPRQLLPALACALLIGANWGLYIYSVETHRVLQASLGYFMTPLVNVALGVVVLKERVAPTQRLAIGLALQGTLSNVASGIMLLLLRPFSVGDWVESNGISGTVREIGLFSTQIDTFENVFISVPNSSIWSSTIVNNSRHTVRRMDLDIGIGYDSDLDVVEKALLSLSEDDRVLADPEPVFLVVDYADSAIVVRLRLYAQYDDFFALSWDLKRRLKPLLDAHDIEIPFPQRVVHHLGSAPEDL